MEQDGISVSVIIPIYNAEEYITQCINSVQKQSLKALEMVCVDDGSVDSSVEIIKGLQKTEQRILLYHQDHGGAGRARNFALSVARGTYISFLDADDQYLDPYALESMVKACEKENVSICGSLRKEWAEDEEIDVDLFHGKTIPEDLGCKMRFEEFQEDFHFQSFLFNRSFLIKNQIFFPEYCRYEDPPFFLRAMIQAREFWVCPLILYRYRGGHFLKKVNVGQMRDTLLGIYDDLLLSAENRYEILYGRLIDRVNFLYREDIEHNLSREVLEILLKIDTVDRLYYKKGITILEELYQIPVWFNELKDGFNQLKERQYDLWESYEMIRKIVKIIQGPGFRIFFDRNAINTVVVYGLGMYGEILINSLKKERIQIVAGIDKKVHEWEGVLVIDPDDDIPECDAIIISAMQTDEILSLLQQKKVEIPILTFKDIVETIWIWMENNSNEEYIV